jgi:predicted transcriptional regulator
MLSIEKTTFNLPSDLKQRVTEIKDELHMSMSSIYVEAIKQYVEQKEKEKWEKAALKASKDENYLKFAEELDEIQDDIYEY